nr:RNA-directed DNA polymerase, eukaryota [Tanacetum cinerariifolium]
SDGDFSVKDARTNIDDMFLPSYNDSTRWVNGVPIRINIFAWRARRDCLPTRLNLIRRGVTLETASCPIRLAWEEDASHVFWLRRFYGEYADGGRLFGSRGLRFRSGWPGSQTFGSHPKLKVY